MDEVDDVDLVVERVAALDLGKAALEPALPHEQRPGRRMQELRGWHHHRAAVGDGGLAAAVARAAVW